MVQCENELDKPCWSIVQREEFRQMLCIFCVGKPHTIYCVASMFQKGLTCRLNSALKNMDFGINYSGNTRRTAWHLLELIL